MVNASSRASEYLLITRANLAQAIEALKEAEVWIVGLDQAGTELGANSRHLKGPLGLVVGSGARHSSPGAFEVRYPFEAPHAVTGSSR